VRIQLLGTVEARGGAPAQRLSGRLRKSVLAFLALRPGQLAPTDRIIQATWGDAPPRSATNTLQQHISYLRQFLGDPALIRSRASGYVLAGDADITDLALARRLVEEARRAADAARAADLLASALALWRDDALCELRATSYFANEAARLDEFKLGIVELLAEARLRLGAGGDVVADLEALAAAHPFRERLRRAHVLGLYRASRQSDALAALRDLRRRLRRELGVDPHPATSALEAAILRQDPALLLPAGKAAAGPAAAGGAEAGRAGAARPGGVARPGRLPAAVTTFVGRQAEADQLAAALRRARIITVTGIGGAGKTRLALAVAGRLDGEVAFVELANIDPDEWPRRVAAAVGAIEDDEDPLAATVAVLGRRPYLLILDNCEQGTAAGAALVAALTAACPGLTVLATSREPLGAYGETRLPLGPLPVPAVPGERPTGAELAALRACPSMRLLLDRAAAALPGFELTAGNAAPLAEICRRLDGIPLALELAAARLGVLAPAELVDGLREQLALPSGSPAGPARHRTLRAALDWSHDLLTAAERTAFGRFSVFGSPVTFGQARQVCLPDRPAPVAVDVLSALVRKSLLTRFEDAGRSLLGMHATVREYAAGLLDTDGLAGSRRAHARTMAAGAAEWSGQFHGPGEAAALARLRRHDPDLQAVLGWAVEQEPAVAGELVRQLWWYWFRTSQLRVGRRWAAAAVRSGTEPDLAAYAYAAGGYLAWVGDDFAAGEADARKALALPRCPPAAAGIAHGVLSRIAGDEDRYAAAVDAAQQAESIFDGAGDRWGAAWSRRCRAAALVLAGRPEQGRALAEDCRRQFDQLGDAWGLAGTVDLLAGIERRLGNYEQAVSLAQDAVRRHRVCGDNSGTRLALQHLAESARHVGDLPLAGSAAADSLRLSEQHGLRYGVVKAALLLGELHADAGDAAAAVPLLDRAARLARELGDTDSEQQAAQAVQRCQRPAPTTPPGRTSSPSDRQGDPMPDEPTPDTPPDEQSRPGSVLPPAQPGKEMPHDDPPGGGDEPPPDPPPPDDPVG
jgi:predicted ATPase/DNA-binding SARP family transcriptional activator